VIRTLFMLTWWGLSILLIGPFLLLYTLLSGSAEVMYRVATKLGITGVRLAGIEIEVQGLENLQPKRSYVFMSNHVSNLDPPILVPSIPGRCSVLVKKEVFRIPILGTAMQVADLVPVDRSNRDAAIESVRAAAEVLRRGLSMVIYPEGTRSPDGRLLPFKKGPFHLAMEASAPVVPVTILGTAKLWPKGTWAMHPGKATLIFHPPLDSANFADRDQLMAAVREKIASALPENQRDSPPKNDDDSRST
jgi:1-acyl-sn-glycerol-3-phosphate acyltransferase